MERILRAISVCAAILLASCSNVLTNIYNEDGSQKTGNDRITSPSVTDTSEILGSGLVVIKATAPQKNQIAGFDAGTSEYAVGGIQSADDGIELRCYAEDKWARVFWSAVQVATTTCVPDESQALYTELAEGKAVAVFPQEEGRTAKIILPYGKTKVTATITADDPLFKSEYSVTLTKPMVYDEDGGGTVAQLRDLSFTALEVDASQVPPNYEAEVEVYTPGWDKGADEADRVFSPAQSGYETETGRYWVNEDVGRIIAHLDIPDGVSLLGISYGNEDEPDLYATVANGGITSAGKSSDYSFEPEGGELPLRITTQDSAGIERTYSVTIKKPESTDTSLRKFGYTLTDAPGSPGRNDGISPLAEETTDSGTKDNWGTYRSLLSEQDRGIEQGKDAPKDYGSATLSADYERDVSTITFRATTFHKRAHISYAIEDGESASIPSSWTQADASGIPVDFTTGAIRTLWMRVTAEDGETHGHYRMTVKKPDADDTTLEAIIVTAQTTGADGSGTVTEETLKKESGGLSQELSLSQDDKLLDYDDDGIDADTSVLSFYLRTASKLAQVTYEATAPDGTMESGSAEEKTYGGMTFAGFELDTSDEKFQGTTSISIFINGTEKHTFTLAKANSTLRSLSPVQMDDVVSESLDVDAAPEDLSLTVRSSDGTETISLSAVTKSKYATVSVSAESTEVANNYPTGTVPATCEPVPGSYPPEWTITLGDESTPVPEGTTELVITVHAEGTDDTVYTLSLQKECDSESRLSAFEVEGAEKWETAESNFNNRTEQEFDKDIYRGFEVSPANWPGTASRNYVITTKEALPAITLTALNPSAQVQLQVYESGFVPIRSGTGTLLVTPDDDGTIEGRPVFGTEYTALVISKDETYKRRYIFKIEYSGTEIRSVSSDAASVVTSGASHSCTAQAGTDTLTFSIRMCSEDEKIEGAWSSGGATVAKAQDSADLSLWTVTVSGLSSTFAYADSETVTVQVANNNDTAARTQHTITIHRAD